MTRIVCVLLLIGSLAGCASQTSQTARSPEIPISVRYIPDLASLADRAAGGDATAQFFLAKEFETGKLVTRDVIEAAKWYQLAAAQFYPPAQFYLAAMYGRGEGVSRDVTEAVRLHKLAAEAGYLDSIYPVAYAYENGVGVEKNQQEAVVWYEKGATAGVHFAMGRLAQAYERGELGLVINKEKAAAWRAKQQAAQGGNHNPRPLDMRPVR